MKTIITILALFLSAGCLQVNAQTGRIEGKVTSGGEPAPGVNILVGETGRGAFTNNDGSYFIERVPSGEHTVRFSAIGYKTIFIDAVVKQNITTELNAELKKEIIDIKEVNVTGSRAQDISDTRTSLTDLKPASARMLAGAVTDVFRTLQALPGVLAPNDFSTQLIVRGSTPDQNLIVMDDVEIFNPYRLYGVISMFNPEAVSDINLMAGGFPAMYGDRLSAVIDVTNKEGTTTESIAGNLNASIVSANLILEGKNPFNVPGSWLINSRRTYYDLIIEPFVKNAGLVEDNVTFPNFFDIQTKLVFGPFKWHKFYLNGILSRDGVDLISDEERKTPDSLGVQDLTKNDVLSFAWHYTFKNEYINKLIFSWYRNSGDSEFNAMFLDPSLYRDEFENASPDTLLPYLLNFQFNSKYSFQKYSIEDKFTYLWSEKNALDFGFGVDFISTVFDFDFEIDPELKAFFASNPNIRTNISDIQRTDDFTRYKAYLQNRFSFGDRFYFHPGIRYDYYRLLGKGYLSPRISASYAINGVSSIRASWGIFYQSPGYEKLRDRQVLFDFSPKYTKNLEAERSTHYILGYERWLTQEWKARVEVYYKKFSDLIVQEQVMGTTFYSEPKPGRDLTDPGSWTRPVRNFADSLTVVPVNDSYGEAYGIEFLVEKQNIAGADRINGWFSYAYAHTNRYEYGDWLPFRFDQRHTMNLILNYKVNNWFSIGTRFQFGSGFPITEAVGKTPRIIMQDTNGDLVADTPEIVTRHSYSNVFDDEVVYDVDYGSNANRYASRKPAYHRLDIRFNFYAGYWNADWNFYLDVVNIYNRSNVIGYDYYITNDLELGREESTMFPIIPTLGFSVNF